MLFHTWGQSQVFISMLYAGLAIGAWYDALRFVGRVLEAGRLFTIVLDIVFGVGTAVILILSMLLTNYGEMRVFCLLGAASGVVLYGWTARPLLRLLIARPCAFLGRQVRKLFAMRWAKKVFR